MQRTLTHLTPKSGTERPEPTFMQCKSAFEEMLKSAYFVYRDDEEAQQLLIARKLKERRLRKKRLDEAERAKLNAELEEMKRQEEARRAEEEARKAAEAEKKLAEEKKKREEEEARQKQLREEEAAKEQVRREEERRVEEARREEERRVEEARRQEEEAKKKEQKDKETRERLLATLSEVAQSRDGYTLRTFIAEGESVGLDQELQPVREALQEVNELRKAALWKARQAQEKLASEFKTAKEAQDFGGPVLAAQWRAAVKEVAKPFVMPD